LRRSALRELAGQQQSLRSSNASVLGSNAWVLARRKYQEGTEASGLRPQLRTAVPI
jgi:hypothetical protein